MQQRPDISISAVDLWGLRVQGVLRHHDGGGLLEGFDRGGLRRGLGWTVLHEIATQCEGFRRPDNVKDLFRRALLPGTDESLRIRTRSCYPTDALLLLLRSNGCHCCRSRRRRRSHNRVHHGLRVMWNCHWRRRNYRRSRHGVLLFRYPIYTNVPLMVRFSGND